jgi:uncharacterized phage-like protein YoqJ
MLIAGTGHRPNKLGGYENKSSVELFATVILKQKKIFIEDPSYIISGMALGWDQALCVAAISLNIPFEAAIPFKGQDKMWPQSSRDFYEYLLSKAHKITYVGTPGYSTKKMNDRNIYMVDQVKLHNGAMLTLWDGSKGGTYNCIQYAIKQSVLIHHAWSYWINPLF